MRTRTLYNIEWNAGPGGGALRKRIGLRTVAVPDPVIAFENCAGALRVIDHLGEEVRDTLKSHFGY